MLSTSAMSSASRTGFHNGPSAQSTLAIMPLGSRQKHRRGHDRVAAPPVPGRVMLIHTDRGDSMGLAPLRQFEGCRDQLALRAWISLRRGEVKPQHRQHHVRPRRARAALRLQERGKVGKQCAVDDLDAGAEGVDVVGEQPKALSRVISRSFRG